jgi:regulator of protease activity HflC (stomatin/prohibitin superfamily)
MIELSIIDWVIIVFGSFIAGLIAISGKDKNKIIIKVKAKIEEKGKEKEKDREGNVKVKPLHLMDQIWIGLSVIGTVSQYHPVRVLLAFIFASLVAVWIVFGFVAALLLLLLIILAVVYAVVSYFYSNAVKISAEPPHMGLVTILGKRTEIVLSEGWALRVPKVIDFININVSKVNQDFKAIEKVYTKGNVPVELKGVSVLRAPDPQRLIEFINVGGEKGVEDALEDIVPDVLRGWAKKYDIDKLLEVKKKAVEEVIQVLTGHSGENMEKDLRNGIPDNQLLGTVFYRFTVGTVEPGGDYGKEIEKVKLEELQQKYELIETDTELLQAEKIQERFKEKEEEISLEKALRMVRDYKTQRDEKAKPVVPGLGDLLSSGVSVVEILKLVSGEKK